MDSFGDNFVRAAWKMGFKTDASALEKYMEPNYQKWVEMYRQMLCCPYEVIVWLVALERALGKGEVRTVLGGGHLMVESPRGCDCDVDLFDGDKDPHRWIHNHHAMYNRRQREIVQATIGLDRLREVIEADLKGPESTDNEGNALEGFGQLLRRDYACFLLDNFINSDACCR